jgi:hypothetical protein
MADKRFTYFLAEPDLFLNKKLSNLQWRAYCTLAKAGWKTRRVYDAVTKIVHDTACDAKDAKRAIEFLTTFPSVDHPFVKGTVDGVTLLRPRQSGACQEAYCWLINGSEIEDWKKRIFFRIASQRSEYGYKKINLSQLLTDCYVPCQRGDSRAIRKRIIWSALEFFVSRNLLVIRDSRPGSCATCQINEDEIKRIAGTWVADQCTSDQEIGATGWGDDDMSSDPVAPPMMSGRPTYSEPVAPPSDSRRPTRPQPERRTKDTELKTQNPIQTPEGAGRDSQAITGEAMDERTEQIINLLKEVEVKCGLEQSKVVTSNGPLKGYQSLAKKFITLNIPVGYWKFIPQAVSNAIGSYNLKSWGLLFKEKLSEFTDILNALASQPEPEEEADDITKFLRLEKQKIQPYWSADYPAYYLWFLFLELFPQHSEKVDFGEDGVGYFLHTGRLSQSDVDFFVSKVDPQKLDY